MIVERAAAAGTCYGVQRALDIARAQSERGADVKSLGPLIHNPSVVQELSERGIEVIHEVPASFDGTIIVRSHGVSPSVQRELAACGARIADATCPYVLRAQQAAARLSREVGYVVVIGDPHHPEVEAICEYARDAGGEVVIVDRVGAVPATLPERIGVVVQTTQNRAVFEDIMARLRSRAGSVELRDTICSATSRRQEAAAALARRVDAMVVIGGHNSSNTTRLYEICKAICPKTYHVEGIAELDPSALADCKAVGVTAGASTPEEQIVRIVDYLERL